MGDTLRSILAGAAGLWVAFAVATALTFARRGWNGSRGVVYLGWLAIGAQTVHFAEEWITGFRSRFPALLGLAEWPAAFFAIFNLAWIAIWVLALWALARGVRLAVLPVWFLGLAMAANGIAHPALALIAGGYFPGLYTSPVEGALGFALLLRLLAATSDRAKPRPQSVR